MTDWTWPCSWFAEAAEHQRVADALRADGRNAEAEAYEFRAVYTERVGMGGVDGAREAIDKGYS